MAAVSLEIDALRILLDGHVACAAMAVILVSYIGSIIKEETPVPARLCLEALCLCLACT